MAETDFGEVDWYINRIASALGVPAHYFGGSSQMKFILELWWSNNGWRQFVLSQHHLSTKKAWRKMAEQRRDLLFKNHWRIVRQSDGIILAQSKDAPK